MDTYVCLLIFSLVSRGLEFRVQFTDRKNSRDHFVRRHFGDQPIGPDFRSRPLRPIDLCRGDLLSVFKLSLMGPTMISVDPVSTVVLTQAVFATACLVAVAGSYVAVAQKSVCDRWLFSDSRAVKIY